MSLILLGILNSQAAAAGGAGAYDLLETQTLASDAASVTFTGLGSYTDYKHLQMRMTLRGDRSASGDLIYLTFNSDTGANYAQHALYADIPSSVQALAGTSQNQITLYQMRAASATSDAFAAMVTDILDFSSSNKNTTIRNFGAHDNFVGLSSGGWFSTASVTSLSLEPAFGTNFVTGCRFSLYGLKAGA